ncbi:MAG: N-acetylmuramoyl-L-alanine amidase [Bacillota bacterium]|nr:N-acetylmuramoyl-L-alanine amidase [Bacillota bacterium]
MNIVINGVIVVFISFKLKNLLKIVFIIALIVVLLVIFGTKEDSYPVAGRNMTCTLVLDPGHGGIDGGAISAAGAKESDINLKIALKAEALADFTGIKTVLTRSTDTDGSENGHYSERQNLLNRIDIIDSTDNAVLISIHQNEYPSDIVRGAEVMYAETSGSQELAAIIQDNFVSKLDPENRRVSRPAPESLLVTSSIKCPGVLAECGFMSCSEEAERLSSYEYQLKIAEILIASFLQFSSDKTA